MESLFLLKDMVGPSPLTHKCPLHPSGTLPRTRFNIDEKYPPPHSMTYLPLEAFKYDLSYIKTLFHPLFSLINMIIQIQTEI